MILGTKDNGQKILLRCGCSHDFTRDAARYYEKVKWKTDADDFCRKCELYGWRITGMTDEELRRREV